MLLTSSPTTFSVTLIMKTFNTFQTQSVLKVGNKEYTYFSLPALAKKGFDIERFPYSIKILIENLLRNENNLSVFSKDIENLARWNPKAPPHQEINFTPARVILQDFTGVPAVCDLAVMRDAMQRLGGDPQKINPLFPSELVIDHSVQVDSFGTPESFAINEKNEYDRNEERYVFLRWGQNAFRNFKVVPPDTGIVHQVNLEFLSRVVFQNEGVLYPDTLVGTDSHTTMVNGLGVLGWGVGGIEAEAVMLGQPITMLIPQVLGVKVTGKLPEGTTATDLVLTVTQILRQKKVVGKFVEFFGSGLSELSLADRATIGNMSPEYGSTCAIFPIDEETIKYLKFSGRSDEQVALVEAYAKVQGLYRTNETPDPLYSETIELDLGSIVPCIAGPSRPQDRIALTEAKKHFETNLNTLLAAKKNSKSNPSTKTKVMLEKNSFELSQGDVVIAAITSCTNTSNPSILIAAGLVAKKAVEKGLSVKPWVKTSLAPGSQTVTAYLQKANLLDPLSDLKFNLVGYGCTTCIGNSGPLPDAIAKAITDSDLIVSAVLSGNRNFEGRINPHVRANYLASPPLVVAYAIAGKMNWDPYTEPLGQDKNGKDVFLKDVWPSDKEISEVMVKALSSDLFKKTYSQVFEGAARWKALKVPSGDRFAWDKNSTYVQPPPFFDTMEKTAKSLQNITKARVLAIFGDSVTTDHISPAGSIAKDSPAAKYLMSHGVDPKDFNQYGARRGNHEVMMRGTFANIRIKNLLLPGTEGGITRHFPSNQNMSIFDAAMNYQKDGVPLVILAGKEYGSGSSRDWAAKGPALLGIKVVIAESYERIHRSNLVGMGILPLQFLENQTASSVGLTGEEIFEIEGMAMLKVGNKIIVKTKKDSQEKTFEALVRIDTPVELEYFKNGGILQYVLRGLIS